MIKNIIFDMGNVLLRYEPREAAKACTENAEDAEAIFHELFEGPEWPRLDAGTLAEDEAIELVCARLPERLRPGCRRVFGCWHDFLPPIPEIHLLAAELKQAGLRLYLCSNASKRFYQYYRRYPVFSLMDGLLVSADEGCIKPGAKIYHRLFEKFNLNPAECFFLDDMPANIAGGRACGMDGYVFDNDIPRLSQILQEKLGLQESFDSEYCHVSYLPKDHVVLLTWKKFCHLEDYRKPTMFAANLLIENPGSNFIIDARNGFEDDPKDVAWGFSVLLPTMAKSDCKVCIFIMKQASSLDGEIDLWTKEFLKYFEVRQTKSYEDAVAIITQLQKSE